MKSVFPVILGSLLFTSVSNCTWRQHHSTTSLWPNVPSEFISSWYLLAWCSSRPTETVRTERPTEETRASVVATRCGASPSGPALRSQPRRRGRLKRRLKETAACSWPPAWRTEWSKSGACLQVSACSLLGEVSPSMFSGWFLNRFLSFMFRWRCIWPPWPWRRREGPGLPSERDAHAHINVSGQDFEDLGPGSERCVCVCCFVVYLLNNSRLLKLFQKDVSPSVLCKQNVEWCSQTVLTCVYLSKCNAN